LEVRRMDIAGRATTTVAAGASLRAFEATGQAALVVEYSDSSNVSTLLRLDLLTGATAELGRTRTDVQLSPSGSRFLALADAGEGPIELRLIDLAGGSVEVLEPGSDLDPTSFAALVGETRVAYTTRSELVVFGPR